MPKSITLGLPGASSTLRGLRSRWITPAPWMAVSAVATPIATLCRLAAVSGPRSLDHLGQAGAVDVLDHQVGRVVVGVGVEHLGGAERRHLPGPVDLAAEPAPELVVGRQVGADHLDRDQPPPGVAGQVDGAHAALAEPADELVLAEGTRIVRAQRLRTVPRHENVPVPPNLATSLYLPKSPPGVDPPRRLWPKSVMLGAWTNASRSRPSCPASPPRSARWPG